MKIPGNTLNDYYKSDLWQCSASPHGAHHWLINRRGIGQCKYCYEKKQFVYSDVIDYGDGANGGWYNKPLSKEQKRELLYIA